jgi:hypothetical protein
VSVNLKKQKIIEYDERNKAAHEMAWKYNCGGN